jgi:hypothetical protein
VRDTKVVFCLKDRSLLHSGPLMLLQILLCLQIACEVYLSQLNVKYSKQNNKDALLKRYNNYFMALLQVRKKMDKHVYETLIDNNQKKLYDNVVGIIKNSNKY